MKALLIDSGKQISDLNPTSVASLSKKVLHSFFHSDLLLQW